VSLGNAAVPGSSPSAAVAVPASPQRSSLAGVHYHGMHVHTLIS
jgi:hypothetical protein